MSELSGYERKQLDGIEQQLAEQLTPLQWSRFTRFRSARLLPSERLSFWCCVLFGVAGPVAGVLVTTMAGPRAGLATAIGIALLFTVLMLAGADWD
ncbi:DUF3040 domain-containing protein [Sciscionella sediminilitoris]|uniref:DUF3040 domain-containing protein n=1 Tax=Sciscionella sediminilitoris TaxID=1445613 RepID=UPI0004DF72D6|nr:DUF3040 domain-containing protein [Sciscionella sp. SE31]